MISINVIDDRFNDIQNNQNDILGGKTALGARVMDRNIRTVRRPVRGITLKEETFATMRVVTGAGDHILLTDAGGMSPEGSQSHRKTQVYSNFLLQQVNEERMEKQQILETFGEPFIFLFGERPRMINFSGVLLNTFDFNWEAEWWDNYEKYLRGTRCVENDARVFIAYDENLVSGYILASSSAKNTQEPNHVNFNFTMFLTGYSNFSDIGNGTAIPVRAREKAQKITGVKDQITFQVQGPNALLPGEVLTGALAANATVSPPSLAAGLQSGLSAVVSTFQKAQSLVNTAVTNLANLANGDVLRVPFGFAGVLAYDEADLVRTRQIPGTDGAYGVVKYSEFKDNRDEYIGASSHYGSSQKAVDNPTIASQFVNLNQLTKDTKLMLALRAEWAVNGFVLPSDEAASVSGFLLTGGTGMLAAGNTAAWQASAVPSSGIADLTPATAARAASPVPTPF